MLICKKEIKPHWGTEFAVGETYVIESYDTVNYRFKIKYDKYFDILKELGKYHMEHGHIFNKEESDRDEKLVEEYVKNTKGLKQKAEEECTILVDIKMAMIKNESGILESFVVNPREWWEEKYEVKIGKSSFQYTVKFLDDYFDNTQQKRNDKIDDIIDEGR